MANGPDRHRDERLARPIGGEVPLVAVGRGVGAEQRERRPPGDDPDQSNEIDALAGLEALRGLGDRRPGRRLDDPGGRIRSEQRAEDTAQPIVVWTVHVEQGVRADRQVDELAVRTGPDGLEA